MRSAANPVCQTTHTHTHTREHTPWCVRGRGYAGCGVNVCTALHGLTVSARSVVASYKPPMLVTRVRLPACAECAGWPEGSRPPWIQHSTHFCQGSTVFANRGAQLWHCHERRNRTRSSRMGSQYEAIVLCACWKIKGGFQVVTSWSRQQRT